MIIIMSGKKCCVPFCTSVYSKDISTFSLPTDEVRRREWIAIIGSGVLVKNARVCQLHFDVCYFKTEKRNRLTNDAVPTLFLRDEAEEQDAVADEQHGAVIEEAVASTSFAGGDDSGVQELSACSNVLQDHDYTSTKPIQIDVSPTHIVTDLRSCVPGESLQGCSDNADVTIPMDVSSTDAVDVDASGICTAMQNGPSDLKTPSKKRQRRLHKTKHPKMTDSFEESLILEVKANEILYNLRHPHYKNNHVRQQIWNKISKNMNSSNDKCQKTWKILRYKYMKERKETKHVKSESSATYKHKWYLYTYLQFLEAYVNDVDTTSNMELTNIDFQNSPIISQQEPEQYMVDDVDSVLEASNHSTEVELIYHETKNQSTPELPATVPIQKSYTKPKKQRTMTPTADLQKKILEELATPPIQIDEHDHFCLSLAASLRKMPMREQLRIKCEISKLLCDATYINN